MTVEYIKWKSTWKGLIIYQSIFKESITYFNYKVKLKYDMKYVINCEHRFVSDY